MEKERVQGKSKHPSERRFERLDPLPEKVRDRKKDFEGLRPLAQRYFSKLSPEQLRDLKGIPVRYRSLFVKVAAGKASLREAVKAKCQDCNGHEDAVVRTRECNIPSGPLWAFRPYQKTGHLRKEVNER